MTWLDKSYMTSYYRSASSDDELVSDIAAFVLKRDVKLQPTNEPANPVTYVRVQWLIETGQSGD